MALRVQVVSAVHATESGARVREAVTKFLPDAVVDEMPDRITATGHDLRGLRQRVWELRIIDTFRARFQAGLQTDPRVALFQLSKQAALAGKVSFPPRPHPLGELDWSLVVEPGDPWPDAAALAWWLAPETRDGEIVGPVDP